MMTSPTSPASPGTPPLVAIESPLSGDFITNTVYARMALRDSVVRGEAPLASHLLYTQVLDDTDPADRQLGMAAGLAWNCHAELVAVYTGLGISAGMQAGIDLATVRDIPIVFRDLAPPQRMPEAGERVYMTIDGGSDRGVYPLTVQESSVITGTFTAAGKVGSRVVPIGFTRTADGGFAMASPHLYGPLDGVPLELPPPRRGYTVSHIAGESHTVTIGTL